MTKEKHMDNSRIRVGVVGCGVIAQVMHLPHLVELEDRFALAAVCDISEDVASECARRFGAAKSFTSWEAMLAEPLDAVLVLTSGSHAPIAVAAAQAGVHVFVEKPMCLNLDEGLEMTQAAERAGVRLMVGTMKRYDPAYERMLEVLPDAGELRLVRVTTLESPFEPYIEGYAVTAPGGAPPELLAQLRREDEQRLELALPGADAETLFCYRWMLLDNLVHELNALRGALGEPREVKYAELGRRVVNISIAFETVDCHLSWVDLPGMARYRQELAFYGLDARVTLTLPSPYLRGMPTELAIEGGEAGASHAWRTVETVSYVEAFKRELIEFHQAIVEGRPARTDGLDGLHDVALCHAIARVHLTGKPIERPSDIDRERIGASA
jgi:predicted dehydrogenase